MSYRNDDDGAAPGRPKLSLAPRSTNANENSAPAPKSGKPNPFGAARPREAVIAEREGKRETDLLKELAEKEWKPTLVLTEGQREEKKALESELAFTKEELNKAVDPVDIKTLREEVASQEKKLEELLASFEQLAVQKAQSGGAKRPSERRHSAEERQGAEGGGAYGGGAADGFRNFSRQDSGDRNSSYGTAWGGRKERTGGGGGGAGCYNCGEPGHFSRECPNAQAGGSSFGGGRGRSGGGGGGRNCYNCGEEGHISRECPQGGGGYGGSRGGSYGGGGGGYGGGSYDNFGGGDGGGYGGRGGYGGGDGGRGDDYGRHY